MDAWRRWLGRTATQDCYFCGGPSATPLCAPCTGALPRLPASLCPGCALPSPTGGLCGRCMSDKPHYDATVAALAYVYPLDAAIQAFKYEGRLGLTGPFAAQMAQALAEREAGAVDLVIATPLTGERLAERGYNQAFELARALARQRRVKLELEALTRVKGAPPQAELPWKERARNIRGAYAAARRFDGLSVAVVDDVMTTGSTLNEIAKTLKKAGAAHVSNWVLARTLPAAMMPAKA
jgi:ComF family protein